MIENKEEFLNNFINHARKYVGTKFKHQGRSKDGMDCIGVIIVPLNEIGFFNYDNTNYKRLGLGGEIIAVISKYCKEVIEKPYRLEKGDILLFSVQNSQHLAIYTGETIIHANNKIGKVVEHRLDNEYLEKISKVYRYNGGI